MKINEKQKNTRLTDDLLERFREVEPATIGHHLHYGFMDPSVKSMLDDVKVVGTAFTVKTTTNDSTMVHKAVSLAEEGDVLVIDRTGDKKHAAVGEMVVYAAKARSWRELSLTDHVRISKHCVKLDFRSLRQVGQQLQRSYTELVVRLIQPYNVAV